MVRLQSRLHVVSNKNLHDQAPQDLNDDLVIFIRACYDYGLCL